MPTASVNLITEAVEPTTSVKVIINCDLSTEVVGKTISVNAFCHHG